MTKFIKDIYISFNNIFEEYFSSDDSLISKDGQQILSNSSDKEIYFETLEKLKEKKESTNTEKILTKKIVLSNGSDVTVVY